MEYYDSSGLLLIENKFKFTDITFHLNENNIMEYLKFIYEKNIFNNFEIHDIKVNFSRPLNLSYTFKYSSRL